MKKQLEIFKTKRTEIISEMLDNPDESGIYPTTKCFEALDKLFEEALNIPVEEPFYCQCDKPDLKVPWERGIHCSTCSKNVKEYSAQPKQGEGEESQLKPQEGEWTKNKPTEKGLYFRSNPALQKDITQQDVHLVNGELKTYHPQNEGCKLINVKDMPSRFLWIKVSYPPHYKYAKNQ